MVAYTVGLIVGALTTVFPLIYLMNFERCIAQILSKQPDFNVAQFSASTPVTPSLLSGITIIGAVVLLLSMTLIAFTGFRGLQSPDDKKAHRSTKKDADRKEMEDQPTRNNEETEI